MHHPKVIGINQNAKWSVENYVSKLIHVMDDKDEKMVNYVSMQHIQKRMQME